MPENPVMQRYLDAGLAFTQMTRTRAEEIVAELIRLGEAQAARTEELVTELVDRSRQNRERFLDVVRTEVQSQIAALGLATQDDVRRLEDELAATRKALAAARKKAAPKKPGPKKPGAKKPGAKKSAAGRASARS